MNAGPLANNPVGATPTAAISESMPQATTAGYGTVILATPSETTTGKGLTKVPTVASVRQGVLCWLRENMGKFPGMPHPSLNLFCGGMLDDTVPLGTFSRSTAATRHGNAGLVETVAAGKIRREWNEHGQLLGWLLEEMRVNACTHGGALENSSWNKVRSTIIATNHIAPDGINAFEKIIENKDSGGHYIQKALNVCQSTSYCLSGYFKAADDSIISLAFVNNVAPYIGHRSVFNIKDETILSSRNVDNASFVKIDDGLYRFYITFTTDLDQTSVWVRFQLTASEYTGDGSSGLYIWGVQAEAGTFPSSYIQTNSRCVIRSADVWTIALDPSWFRPTAGTMFLAGRTAAGAPLPDTAQVLAQYDDGSMRNRICLLRDAGRMLRCVVTTMGIELVNLRLGTIDDRTAFCLAASWSSEAFSATLNGRHCITVKTSGMPAGLTGHSIGCDAAGKSQWGGHVLHDAYFPAVLSDKDKMAITL